VPRLCSYREGAENRTPTETPRTDAPSEAIVRVKIVEVTNGIANWGKFLLGRFDTEWDYKSAIDGISIIAGRGWSLDHFLLLDLQTGEGAIFRPGGLAKADLDKHRIWVCPMYEPFLTWLYKQPDPFAIPTHVDLPDAEFAFAGYRRPGPADETR
jgi:hypothetical protein